MMQNIPTHNASMRTRLRMAGASLLAMATAPFVQADFEMVTDFETGVGDTTFSQSGFGTGNAEVIADPVYGDSNLVLAVNAGDVNTNNIAVSTPVPNIPDGGMGTFFIRFAVDSSESNVNGTLALSPIAEPNGWGDCNMLFNPNSTGGFSARNADAYVEVAPTRANLNWYKAWYIIDTANDLYDVYLQGGMYTTPTLVAEDFAFRKNVEGEDIMTFFIYMNSGGSGAEDPNTNGFYYVDDLYIDIAEANMTDPTPDAAPNPMFHFVDGFEGTLDAWTVTPETDGTGTAEIVPDPIGSANVYNNVLAVRPGDVVNKHILVDREIPTIMEGRTGTVFLRIAVDSSEYPLNGTYAVGPVEAPTGWGDANVLFNPNSTGGLSARDGTSYVVVAESRENLTWYKVWYVIDTPTDTYDVYIQGGEYEEVTQLVDDFGFRKNAEGEDLVRFFIRMWSQDSVENLADGLFYLDDLYVDPMFVNMSDPYQDNAYPKPQLGLYKTDAEITVDGVKDDSGYTGRGFPIGRFGGTVDGPDDLSATLFGAWTEAGLNLFVSVTDDVFSVDGDVSYRDDSIEFGLDPDDNDNGNYDGVNDVKLTFSPQEDGTVAITNSFPAPPSGVDYSGVTGAYLLTDAGYDLEAFIPWEALQIWPLMGNWQMGLAVQVNDDDGVDLSDPADGFADSEGYLSMTTGNGNINFNTASFADIFLWSSLETVVRRTSSEITIDGVRDDAFSGPVNILDNRWTGTGSHPSDNSAKWRMIYDDDNLYLFLEVVDDSVIAGESEQSWHDDGLEFAIDGNNNKGGGFDGNNDVKITFRLMDLEGGLEIVTDSNFPPPPAGTDFSGLEAAQMVTDVGYNLEVKLPLSIFKMDAMPLDAFGIEFNLSDDDDGGNREGVLTWSSGGGVNNNTDDYGTAYIYGNLSTEIVMTESEMTIDGEMEADYEASGWNPIARTSGEPVLGNDASGYWTAVYDADNLYLLIDIMDDDISFDTPGQAWNDDGLEIFFDPGNDDNGGFDGVDDVKISAVVQPGETSPLFVTTGNFPAPPAGTDFSGLEGAWVETALGWRMEIKVPMVTLRMNGVPGATLGFEVSLQDDDEGGSRDHIFTWSTIGNTNFGTHLYGTIIFAGEGAMFSTIIGAENVEGNTYDSDWLGMFEEDPEKAGWIEHEGLGWLYTGYAMPGDSAFWVYSITFGDWLYLTDAYFPWVYFIAEGWGYYVLMEDEDAYIYYYDSDSWVEIE